MINHFWHIEIIIILLDNTKTHQIQYQTLLSKNNCHLLKTSYRYHVPLFWIWLCLKWILKNLHLKTIVIIEFLMIKCKSISLLCSATIHTHMHVEYWYTIYLSIAKDEWRSLTKSINLVLSLYSETFKVLHRCCVTIRTTIHHVPNFSLKWATMLHQNPIVHDIVSYTIFNFGNMRSTLSHNWTFYAHTKRWIYRRSFRPQHQISTKLMQCKIFLLFNINTVI